MTDAVVARSAKLGDICVRDIPRLLTKEEIRDLSRIDSVKFSAAALLEFGLIAAPSGSARPGGIRLFTCWPLSSSAPGSTALAR